MSDDDWESIYLQLPAVLARFVVTMLAELLELSDSDYCEMAGADGIVLSYGPSPSPANETRLDRRPCLLAQEHRVHTVHRWVLEGDWVLCRGWTGTDGGQPG